MNGHTYGNIKSNPYSSIIDAHTVPQEAKYVFGDIMSGGNTNQLMNSRLVMYDNDSTVWSPMNKTGSVLMAYPKPDGTINMGNMDPVIRGGNLPDKYVRPAQKTPDKPIYNFV